MRVGNWIVLSLVVGLVLVATGCKPKVGGKCKAGAVVCTKEGALFCGDDGKYVATGCHGPAGCTAAGTASACDASLALAGEGCEVEGNIACAVDKKAQLDCKNHTWVVGATCKGAKGCEFKDEELFCDHAIADKDDPCHRDGQIACTNDRALIMKCQDHVFTPIDACRGPTCVLLPGAPRARPRRVRLRRLVRERGRPVQLGGLLRVRRRQEGDSHLPLEEVRPREDVPRPQGVHRRPGRPASALRPAERRQLLGHRRRREDLGGGGR